MGIRIRIVCAALAIIMAAGEVALAAGTEPAPMTPREVRHALATAQAFIDNGQYRRAVTVLDEIVAGRPRNADAHNLLGYSWRRMKLFDRAEEHYMTALAVAPAHRGALEYAGELYLQTGRNKEAEAMLVRLEAACPQGCAELDALRAAFADPEGRNW